MGKRENSKNILRKSWKSLNKRQKDQSMRVLPHVKKYNIHPKCNSKFHWSRFKKRFKIISKLEWNIFRLIERIEIVINILWYSFAGIICTANCVLINEKIKFIKY